MNMSRFTVVVDDERRIVRVTHVGELDVSMAKKMVSEARSKAYDLGYNLLYDFRESFIKVSAAEMYFLPREHDLPATPEAGRQKSANLIPLEDGKADWHFYESTAQNAGLSWRAFKDEEEALKWLAKDPA